MKALIGQQPRLDAPDQIADRRFTQAMVHTQANLRV